MYSQPNRSMEQQSQVVNMALGKVDFDIEIEGEQYRLDTVPADTSSVVVAEKEKLLGAVDLKTLVNNLGRIGIFFRIASNGVVAAGPNFAGLQIEIRHLGLHATNLCHKCAQTSAKIQEASSIVLTDLQATYEYLLDSLEEMAIETLSAISKLAHEIGEAALELHQDFDGQAVKIEEALHHISKKLSAVVKTLAKSEFELHHDFGQEAVEVEVESVHHSMGALKELSAVMMLAAQFWKQMQNHCHSLADSEMQRVVQNAVKLYTEEKQRKIWTAKGFQTKTIHLYAGWVSLHSVCSVYVEQIKLMQRDLYQYLKENPTWKESRMNVKSLAENFLSNLKRDQKAISDKEFQAEKEIKALQGYEVSELTQVSL